MKFMTIAVPVGLMEVADSGIRVETQGQTDRRLANAIKVTGTGEAEFAPDIAFVIVGVVTTGARAQDAAQSNAAVTTKVMDASRGLELLRKTCRRAVTRSARSTSRIHSPGGKARGLSATT